MKNILVTGGAGFIGSNFVRMVLGEKQDTFIVNLDKLTYAGNLENLDGFLDKPNHKFVKGDICDGPLVEKLIEKYKIEAIINFAAESHVDRSIAAPKIFIETNIKGTLTLLEAAREKKIKRFIQISTDEVTASLVVRANSQNRRPIILIRRIQRARLLLTTWLGLSVTRGLCRII